MPNITPFLWFNNNAEEAVEFYASVFKNSGKLNVKSNTEAESGKAAKAMVIPFELEGQPFLALNGGPQFPFTEAVSFMVHCKDQEEIDYFWDALMEGGGKPSQCGWLKDKFGLSWQVVPENLGALLGSPKAMKALMGMTKLHIKTLQEASSS